MRIYRVVREYAVPIFYLAAILWLVVAIIGKDFPKEGHDYGFFLPRMLDTHLHHKVDGLGIQWYTANFGAGTPAYPNPQYIQYSLPQFLMFAVNPWTALMLSLVTYAVIGFASFYLFLREEMGWIPKASALGASFILANGFFIEHAIVGHVGFQHFPLLGAILFLAFTKRLRALPAGIMIGMLVALIVNQAGFINLIIFIFSLLILFPLIYLLRPELLQQKLFTTLLTGGLSAVLLSISKVSAVMAFMRSFPRFIEDDYGLTYLEGLFGMIRQLTGFIFVVPYYLLTGRDLEEIPSIFQQGAGEQFGIWETNIFLSPGLLFLLLLGIGFCVSAISKSRLDISRDKGITIVFLVLAAWLAVEMTLAQGWLYSMLKPLPVLRSLHANLRFTSAWIYPFAMLGAFVFHKIFRDHKTGSFLAFLALGGSTVAMLGLYLVIPQDVHNRSFNIQSVLPVYAQVDNGWTFTIQNVIEATDMEAFRRESSNLALQDPMFGYGGEYFEPKAVPGPVLEVRDGRYNMTNPAGYVFPEENNVRPFDLFREDQRTKLELFLNHQQPDLEISKWQRFANVLSLAALILSLLYLMLSSVKGSLRVRQAVSQKDYAQENRVI
jgi:hypothetical protein